MAPILFHGLSQLGLPVVCVESRQAYQALKSLATHKTDRNDARGLAHLARTGFFKPVHVKSLPAHALRSLISARKKLVGQRVTLENQIRGLAVVFGIRLPRALTAAFVNQAVKASEGVAGLSAAMRGLIAARTAVMTAVAAIDADMRRMTRASGACRRLMTIPGVGQLTALAFAAAIDDPSRIRRSRDIGAYLGLVPALVQIAGAGKRPVLYCRDVKLGARHSTLQAQVDLGHPDVPVRIVPCGCDASIRYRRS
jgi:transposase